jgi:ElaB/YqjD/DUF883 family membrane-anchored ribosome-binding protein
MKPQAFDDDATTIRFQARDASLAEAQAEVRRSRDLVVQSAIALRDAVMERTDWRQIVARRPATSLAIAFAIGLWLGHRK